MMMKRAPQFDPQTLGFKTNDVTLTLEFMFAAIL
jgi:hypothetical protein